MTTNQRITEKSENSRFKEPISVENLAENLMEDLFRDIDRVFDGGTPLPTETTRPEIVSLRPIKVPQIIVPPKNTQSQEADKQEKPKLAIEEAKKENQSLDKLLLGAAFASMLVTLSLWLVTRGGLDKILGYLGYVEKPNESAETLNPKAAADAGFADYIERSLKMIEQKETAQKQKQIPGIPSAPSSNNLPTIPIPANPPTNTSLLLPLNRLVDLMEAQVAKEPVTIPETKVVVIPPVPSVLSSAVAAAPESAPSSPKPSAASASNASTEAAENKEKLEADKNAKPEAKEKATQEVPAQPQPETTAKADGSSSGNPKPETKPESEPETRVETESKTEAQPESPAPTEPISLPPPPTTETPSAITVGASQVQTPINTLVGILELGERSAALFEIDGVARRIYVGEGIGASGWTLVKLENQEAVIRRNGEVRSVFVGQQF